MNAKTTIKMTDGRETTVAELLTEYPEAACYDAGGFEVDLTTECDDPWAAADVRDGRVALIWATEADSVNDDGGRAVAEVRRM